MGFLAKLRRQSKRFAAHNLPTAGLGRRGKLAFTETPMRELFAALRSKGPAVGEVDLRDPDVAANERYLRNKRKAARRALRGAPR